MVALSVKSKLINIDFLTKEAVVNLHNFPLIPKNSSEPVEHKYIVEPLPRTVLIINSDLRLLHLINCAHTLGTQLGVVETTRHLLGIVQDVNA